MLVRVFQAALPVLGMIVLLAGESAATMAGAIEILPHRGYYTMSLASVKPSGGVADARGAMMLEWSESCDGWENQQRIRLRVINSHNQEINLDTSFTSSEAKDGLTYRFSSRTKRNGTVEEDLRGRASLDGPGRGGLAIFTRPVERRITLPTGAMFPTAHTILIIDEARKGKKHISRVVFDGATEDGPFEVNALISGRSPPDGVPIVEPAADQAFWRSRLAYFALGTEVSQPVWEIGVSFQENGVARGFLLDYGDFSIKASLEAVEILPRPEC